mgnify:CR=1 FL=1|jgi:hypothetical protein
MKENESYHTVREFNLGQTKIEVCVAAIPTEDDIKKYLTNIYDTINDIAIKAQKRGVDTSKWFYTAKQLQKMKQSNKYNFI